jgi:hypothetical protein
MGWNQRQIEYHAEIRVVIMRGISENAYHRYYC